MSNKILLVKNPEWQKGDWYDKFDSFVVIVEQRSDVVSLISEAHGAYCTDNMPENWNNNPESWEYTELGESDLDKQIVLGSFNAA